MDRIYVQNHLFALQSYEDFVSLSKFCPEKKKSVDGIIGFHLIVNLFGVLLRNFNNFLYY